jgi:site-specific DNA recombinase
MDAKKKKAVAYVRISSQRQINNESPATQREAIKRYAEQHNIEIAEWFEDIAKSGKNADRDGLQALLKYCFKNRGNIDHWIVYNMRRASRDNESYTTEVKLVLRARGITVRSATEPAVDDTKEGRFLETLLVALGQLDNEGKAEVTIDNMRSLAFQGYWQHPPLHGYDAFKIPNEFGKPRPSMKPNTMARKVNQVLERFSKGDITKAEVARYAKEIGLRSRNGNVLTDSSIKKMIETPEYAGFVHDKFTDYQLVEGKHEPIITTDTFERNQLILKGTNKGNEIHLKLNPLFCLKGLLLCIYCSKPLYASSPRTGSGGHSPRYHCSRESCRGKAKSIKVELVHSQFEELLKRLKPSEGILKLYKEILIREANEDVINLNQRIAASRRRLDDLANKKAMAIRKFVDGQLTPEEKNSYIDLLEDQNIKLKSDLSKLEDRQRIKNSDIETAINIMLNVDKQWAEADIDLKVRFQSMIFPEGVVYDFINKKFGTKQLSPLYRLIDTKKGAKAPSDTNLVAGRGLEPLTSWL